MKPKLEELYIQYKDSVLKHLIKLCKNVDLAEELTQETFIRIQKYYHSFDEKKSNLTTWIHIIAKNVYFSVHNSQKKGYTIIEDVNLENPDQRKGPENQVIGNDMRQMLDKILQNLPEPEKSIVILKHFENKSMKEISLHLGVSDRTVSRRLLRAFSLIEENLKSMNVQLNDYVDE